VPRTKAKADSFDVVGWLQKNDKINPKIYPETLEVEDDRFYRIEYRASNNPRLKRVSFARTLRVLNSPGGEILSGAVNILLPRIVGISIVDRTAQIRETKTKRAGKGIDLIKCEFERILKTQIDGRQIKKREKVIPIMMGE
jgi:hypothetical protein